MKIQDAINIIKTYPFYDIDKGDETLRKQLKSEDATPDFLRSYVQAHKQIVIVPKILNGNAPVRNISDSFTLDFKSLEENTARALNGFDTPTPYGANDNFYKVMYENAMQEARDYKRRYEDTLNEKHKVELESASSKNSFTSSLVNGLAGIAPLLMGGGTPLAGLPQATEPQPQQAQPQTQQIQDVRIVAIVKHFSTLTEENKQKVYDLLAKVYGNLEQIDTIINLI